MFGFGYSCHMMLSEFVVTYQYICALFGEVLLGISLMI